jgi:hypothetical protein
VAERVTLYGPRWIRIVPGAIMLGATAVTIVSGWSALLANNPAYPVLLLAVTLLGLWLVVSGLRPKRPVTPGGGRRFLRVLAALSGVMLASIVLWLSPYSAEPIAIDALASDDDVTVTDTRSASTFTPNGPSQGGFVLYPGALVDPRAYAAHAHEIAAQGYTVVVPKCAFDLALLCTGVAGEYLTADMPWSVGGHSLGGTAASFYVDGVGPSDDPAAPDGLVFWASYPQPDLSTRTDLAAASVSGTKDGLTSQSDIISRRDLLPPDTAFTIIAGANHASFGSYGEQAGDDEATITPEQARDEIVQATVEALANAGDAARAMD